MGRNDCESFTSIIISLLIDYTVRYCLVVFFSPSLISYGYAHIECIYKDIKLQERIAKSSKIFWSKIMIPECFLMRIPRFPLPIIFSLDKE